MPGDWSLRVCRPGFGVSAGLALVGGVGGPGVAGVFGVLFGDLGAVAQGLGGDGWGHGEHECAEGGVPGAEEVDAAFSELFHEVAGVEVLSGAVSGEKPGRGTVGCGLHVRAAGEVSLEDVVEGVGDRDRLVVEDDDGFAVLSAADLIHPHAGDAGQRLGVEE